MEVGYEASLLGSRVLRLFHRDCSEWGLLVPVCHGTDPFQLRFSGMGSWEVHPSMGSCGHERPRTKCSRLHRVSCRKTIFSKVLRRVHLYKDVKRDGAH